MARKSVLACCPCGSGKSVMAAAIAASVEGKVLFLIHRRELADQMSRTFADYGCENVKVGLVKTVANHLDDTEAPVLIITDECHHATAETYRKIYDAFPAAAHVGFTATPSRLDGAGLGNIFKLILIGPSVKWLIAHQRLAPFIHYAPPTITKEQRDALHIRHGEFVQSEVETLMDTPKIYGDAIEHWRKYADGRKTICYCVSIAAAEKTAAAFRAAGITAEVISSQTPKAERQALMEKFRAGEITVLTNVDLFGEGLDVPDCSCAVMLRPTASYTIYMQQAMRCMRYQTGKDAVILDHVGNVNMHGMVDAAIDWQLETKKRKARNEVKIRQCKECFAVIPANAESCPFCGYVEPKEEKGRKPLEEVGGELEIVTNAPHQKSAKMTKERRMILKYLARTTKNGKPFTPKMACWSVIKQGYRITNDDIVFAVRQKGWKDGSVYYVKQELEKEFEHDGNGYYAADNAGFVSGWPQGFSG